MAEQTLIISVAGMSCEHCVKAVTDAVVGIPGVADVIVDLDGGIAEIILDNPSDAGVAAIKTAIMEQGYDVGFVG